MTRRRSALPADSKPAKANTGALALPWIALGMSVLVCALVLSRRAPSEPPRAIAPSSTGPAAAAPDHAIVRAPSVRARGLAAAHNPASPAPLVGHVRDGAGQPVQGASVCAFKRDDELAEATPCSLSDAKGRFELRAEGEQLVLVATAAGYRPGRIEAALASTPAALNIILSEGGAALSGTVLDLTGGVIPDAVISARRSDDAPLVAAARSDARGRFRLDLDAGTVLLHVRAELYAPARRIVDAPASELSVALVPASAIHGRVVAEDGAPLALAVVTAGAQAGAEARPIQVSTSSEGGFELVGLEAATYELVARAAQWRTPPLPVSVGVAELREGVVLTARPAARVSARVRFDGEPCAEGQVGLFGPEQAFSALAGEDVVTFDGLLPGSYEIELRCSGAQSRVESVRIEPGQLELSWELAPALASVQGSVIDGSGAPVAGVAISVIPVGEPHSRAERRCTSDDDGAFDCAGLEPGAYTCALATLPGERVPFTLDDADGSARVVIRAHATASIRVRLNVTDPAGAQPTLLALGSDPMGIEPRREGDEEVFEGLPLGRYAIHVGGGLGGEPAALVQLDRAGHVERLTLEAPRALPIVGQVLDALGEVVPDIWVRAYATDSTESGLGRAAGDAALTDASGAFTLSGLLPGSYQLIASGSQGRGTLAAVAAGARRVSIRLEPDASPEAERALTRSR